MEGKRATAPHPQSPARRETVLLSFADTAKHLAQPVMRAFQQQGLDCILDEKVIDPGASASALTVHGLEASALVCMLLGRRCAAAGWRDNEAALAAKANKPVLVFVEQLGLEWPADAVPALLANRTEMLARFVERSLPDAASVWEFGRRFFLDRRSASQFRRAADGGWRWDRIQGRGSGNSGGELSLEMTDTDDIRLPEPGVRCVRAVVKDKLPVLLLYTTDGKSCRLSYSRHVRAVIPSPPYPGSPVIGFMHMDFESGREWPRAGEAPIELRLLGREVYGWHMSETFWRAFVGSLPKMLGTRDQVSRC